MLKKIQIERLFGFYNYDIDFTNQDGSLIKFLTAPNGYGKTTLLDFIYGVFTLHFEKLFCTPFEKLKMLFSEGDNSHSVRVERSEVYEAQEIDSDLIQRDSCKLRISLWRETNDEEYLIEQYALVQNALTGQIEQDGCNDNLEMFMTSRSCHYLTDSRLLYVKTDSHDTKGAMNQISLESYAEDLKQRIERSVKTENLSEKIEIFKKIIEGSDFSNKHLDVDGRFGFRFVLDDELKTKLSLDDLSSGEKHIIIQVYELLFKAQEGTLVLIDEPELSFHMMWQMSYLKNLSDIVRLRDFQCIVSTHSPEIFQGKWDLTVDLFSLHSQH